MVFLAFESARAYSSYRMSSPSPATGVSFLKTSSISMGRIWRRDRKGLRKGRADKGLQLQC
jgi:hypothetical protein